MGTLIKGHLLGLHTAADQALQLLDVPQGALWLDDQGKLLAIGDAKAVEQQAEGKQTVFDYGEAVIMPAFYDLHTHPPQLDIIGSFGHQLLEWLKRFTYPAERAFAEAQAARTIVDRYLDEQLSHGVIAGVWFGTTSVAGTGAMFSAAADRGVRAVIGKVSMDQQGPDFLLQPAEQDRDELCQLFEQWHGYDDRLHVALTPRFAPACSPDMLRMLGDMAAKHSELYVQTHLSENEDEIELAKRSYPQAAHYTGIYDEYQLLGERTILAHCIHLSDAEIDLVNKRRSIVAHCPTSNLFLGSGLCPLHRYQRSALATDIGAGTTLCMWETMRAMYGVAQLQGVTIAPERILAAATTDAAAALGQEGVSARYDLGAEIDVQVIDWRREVSLANRWPRAAHARDRLRDLIALGRGGLCTQVHGRGKLIWSRQPGTHSVGDQS